MELIDLILMFILFPLAITSLLLVGIVVTIAVCKIIIMIAEWRD